MGVRDLLIAIAVLVAGGALVFAFQARDTVMELRLEIRDLSGQLRAAQVESSRIDARLAPIDELDARAAAVGREVATLAERLDELGRGRAAAGRDDARRDEQLAAVRAGLDAMADEVQGLVSGQARLRRDVAARPGVDLEAVNAAAAGVVRQGEQLGALEQRFERLEGEVDRLDPPQIDRDQLRQTLTDATLQLNGDDTVGSATMIFSGTHRGERVNLALTSYHVVRNIFADTPRARREGIEVTIYAGSDQEIVRADLVAHEVAADVALLKLRDSEIGRPVAPIATDSVLRRIGPYTRIGAVGCPLGNDPIATFGEIMMRLSTPGRQRI